MKIAKIIARAEVLEEQLKRVLPQLCVEVKMRSNLKCAVCTNCDEPNLSMITDYSQGVIICLGEDGKECGDVVPENIPVHMTQCNNDFTDPYE